LIAKLKNHVLGTKQNKQKYFSRNIITILDKGGEKKQSEQ